MVQLTLKPVHNLRRNHRQSLLEPLQVSFVRGGGGYLDPNTQSPLKPVWYSTLYKSFYEPSPPLPRDHVSNPLSDVVPERARHPVQP